MNSLLEGSLPFEELTDLNTLYIIGNGFDIAHGIKSSYMNFKEYVEGQGHTNMVEMMDIFFSSKDGFWSDIETALGNYDEKSIIDFCNPEPEFDYDHPTRSEAAYTDSPDYIFYPLLDDFRGDFNSWVNSLNIAIAERIMALSPDARYISFNYTETIEEVYGVSDANVLHLHGKRGDNTEYIVGHASYKNPDIKFDENELYFVQETEEKVIKWMNELYKDTESIIRKNDTFFNNLSNIQQVIVLGHSLNEIDDKYFEKIISVTSVDTPWFFSFYCSKDLKKIRSFICRHGLTNTTIKYFDDFCWDRE